MSWTAQGMDPVAGMLQLSLFMVGLAIFLYNMIGIFREQHDLLPTDNATEFSAKQY